MNRRVVGKKTPQTGRKIWWRLALMLAVALGVPAVIVFFPYLRAGAQYAVDHEHFADADTHSLETTGDGNRLAQLGYQPLGKYQDSYTLWVDCTSVTDATNCLSETLQGRNRLFLTSFGRNWRGVITRVQVIQVGFVDWQAGVTPANKSLTSLTFCFAVYGATVDDLLSHTLPDRKYCM